MNQSPQTQIAYIQAGWHKEIVDQGRIAFVAEMEKLGVSSDRIEVFDVPGSLEILLQAKLLAKRGRFAAIVTAGLIVDGGIYRHEFVADAVIGGLMQVQLEVEVPVLSLVLTPQQFHEHEAHHDFFREHFKVKGAEAAHACAQTLENLANLGGTRAAA